MAAPNAQDAGQKGAFQRFFHSEVSGSIVLLACAVLALVWANSPWAERYFGLVDTYVGVSWGEQTFKMSLGHWIADGLMVLFFFVVGLEIKREVLVGEISSFKRAALPVGAAVGGAVVPAVLYLAFNAASEGARGWGIPMATDIAFALGILALFGKRVPIGLKVFLTALAIADDLIAVLVIAVFYTEQISAGALAFASVFMFLIFVAGRAGVRATGLYIVLAVCAWAGVLASGVHATIAGVLVAMLVPVQARIEPSEFLERARKKLEQLAASDMSRVSPVVDKVQLHALDDLYMATDDMRPAGITLEHMLHPVQSFLILPLFALFKAGIPLDGDSLSQLLEPVSLGIITGLFVGKQLGITLFAWLAIRSGRADMPVGVNWQQIWAVAAVAGVGFTMSIFVAELAFPDPGMIGTAKMGILLASLVSGVFGYLALGRALPKATT